MEICVSLYGIVIMCPQWDPLRALATHQMTPFFTSNPYFAFFFLCLPSPLLKLKVGDKYSKIQNKNMQLK